MRWVFVFVLFCLPSLSDGQNAEIKWYSWSEAISANKIEPRKIFVDMYTDWCGWCKKMDQTTFVSSAVASYLNENYYPIKFNAERKDTLEFENTRFINNDPNGRRGTHQLAEALLNGRLTYPSFVMLTEDYKRFTIMQGYQTVEDLLPVLNYFNTNAYKKMSLEEFKTNKNLEKP